MLEKPEFDCNNLGEFYDCGCSDDEEGDGKGSSESKSKDGHSATTRGDASHSESQTDAHDHLAVEISKEASVSFLPVLHQSR